MPIPFDQPTEPSLHALGASYPDPLKAVFGLRVSDPFPTTIAVASKFRTSPPIKGKATDVTWFGFRSDARIRLPEFYACELPPHQTNGRIVSLYQIGAVGNTFDVDVLLTDRNGNPQATGLFEQTRGGGLTAVVPTAIGFYEAQRAFWVPPPAGGINGSCTNEMTLDVSGNATLRGNPCILWVVSYKHTLSGKRPKTLDYPPGGGGNPSGFLLHQDDDGSPGDSQPGGED